MFLLLCQCIVLRLDRLFFWYSGEGCQEHIEYEDDCTDLLIAPNVLRPKWLEMKRKYEGIKPEANQVDEANHEVPSQLVSLVRVNHVRCNSLFTAFPLIFDLVDFILIGFKLFLLLCKNLVDLFCPTT